MLALGMDPAREADRSSRPVVKPYPIIVDKFVEVPPVHRMDSMSEIMRVLRAARALVGLSQAELAELSGVSRQIVVRIENGENNVLVDAVEKVRRALEQKGAAFTDATPQHGPGVALARPGGGADTETAGN